MKVDSGEIKNSNVNEQLFKDESSYQEKRTLVYYSLIAFTVLLVVAFLLLKTGLAFALTCGVSIGISFSMLILSTMRIGSKSFWFYFAWFMAVLLGFSYFGLPETVIDGLERLGISKDIMIVGSLLQVAMFFVYVAYVQCKDLKRKPLNIESDSIKIEKKFSQKEKVVKSEKKKVKRKNTKKGLLKKFSFNKEKLDDLSEKNEEPKYFAQYRKLALKTGLSLIVLTSLVIAYIYGISYLMPLTFISMFAVTFLVMLIPMIKPDSKRFWYGFAIIFSVVISVFAFALN